MIEAIIRASLRQPLVVLLAVGAVVVGGILAIFRTPVDAIPDLSDVQVIVYTPFEGQGPRVVEDQVTYPLTTAMLAVPGARDVRGFSNFGYSMVYVLFEDGTDLYWARSRVLEALATARSRLPEGVNPALGPDATGVGWVYMYTLTSDNHDLSELRSMQDWFLRFELMSLPGVAEVASAGGFVRQYQITVDPEKLRAYGVSIPKIRMAVERSNTDVGGSTLEMGETEFMIRGKGYIRGTKDIEAIPVAYDPATRVPILLSQVADVQIGPAMRRGLVEMDGRGEVVSGIVVMRYGENALEVIQAVKSRLAELAKTLPEGVEIHTSYDRSELILAAIANLKWTLIKEILVVALICVIFLLHVRSSLVAVLTLPVGILASFIVMRAFGLNANIMSLGGIAIALGVMVDASIVMVENLHKHKERDPDAPHDRQVLDAAKEVGPALFWSLAIITVSFLPVFALERQEGRLFTPLASTKTLAMAASSILAITMIPVLMKFFVRGKMRPENRHPISRALIRAYRPIIHGVLRHPWATIGVAAVILVGTIYPATRLGSEFMPPLNESVLLYMPTTPPGLSTTKAREILQQTDKLIAKHPQVAHVLGKVGRAETATDPAPMSMIETTVVLTPKETWPPGKSIEDIARELDAMVQFPGLTNSWTMPIKTRLDMLATGIRTPLGIKLMGSDLDVLADLGERIEGALGDQPGTRSVYAERATGGHFIDIDVDRLAAAQQGLTVRDVLDTVGTAVGGMTITQTVEGLARYPVNLRFSRDFRDDPEALARLPIFTPDGGTVPLGQVARVRLVDGPPMIKSENARQSVWIYIDTTTSDLGGYVEAAKARIAESVAIPTGVSVQWSGQFEAMARVRQRLALVVPATIVLIAFLLWLHFRNGVEVSIVLLTLPFALVGGIWWMWAADYNLSVAVAVGFISLAGLAAETGVVMLVYLDNAYHAHRRVGGEIDMASLKAAITEGAVERVRPKVMTVATTMLGLVPVMLGDETGARVMKRIAAPMVGGLASSAILTLVIIPAIYFLWKARSVAEVE
ncbi:MAG: efflux RND transporter permease subunit [Deltaproteobacteria bacterium]|nr:efflux RND transporter permease subunit [Deltaproteobacteria bacterium]MCB9479178.1 efflux RND transporter permease subunit [Deltaproteobacteria bacterium]MCB9489151.1 efflux RND transporter permease subunit [Deltaproteobacteria bacterium]